VSCQEEVSALPIYEYQCELCNKRSELLQKFSDPPLSKCPECQGPVRKLISTAGLHFKGSGWYVTDYAKKAGKPASESKGDSKSAKKGSGASASTKKENKPKASKAT